VVLAALVGLSAAKPNRRCFGAPEKNGYNSGLRLLAQYAIHAHSQR
jgi:hypothetical protein